MFLAAMAPGLVMAQPEDAAPLQVELEKENDPIKRVDLLNQLSYAFYDFDDSLAFVYAQRAYQEAKRNNYTRGIKTALVRLGLGYYSQGDFNEALSHYQQSIDLKGEVTEDDAYALQMIGKLYFERGSYDSALATYDRAWQLAIANNDLRRQSTILRNKAHVYLYQWKNQEAFDQLQQSMELLKKVAPEDDYLWGEIWALLGIYYENRLDLEKSKEYYNRMCEMGERRKDYYHMIKCKLNQAELAYREGDFSTSIVLANAALKLSDSYAYPPQVAEIYLMIGEAYAEVSQHDLATRYYYEALEITQKLGLRYLTARLYSNLSWVFYERKDYPNALQYINDARVIRETIGDQRGIGNCYNVVGLIQLDQRAFTDALGNFAKARKIWEAIGHEEGVSAILFNESLVFVQQGDLATAYDYQLKAIDIERKILNEKNLGTSYNFLGNLLVKMNRMEEAASYLEKARTMAKQTGSLIQLRTNHLFWASYYEAKGDFKNAFSEQVRFNAINDSLYRESGALKMAEMEALYQVEQKEQEIKLLNQQAQLKDQEMQLQESSLRLQRGITLAALLAFVVISLFAVSTYRYNRQMEKANREILEQKEEIQAQAEELTEGNQLLTRLNKEVTEKNEEIQAQSEELMEAHDTILRINQSLEERIEKRTNDLKQAYKELDTFFYRSSHDFRRPLTTFLGLAEVAKITVKDHNALELFEKVRETASNLDKMLVKLQSISDVGSQHLVYKEVFPEQLLEDIRQNFETELARKQVDLRYDVKLPHPFHSYPALIRIILENLIENAVFFCGTNMPSIQVQMVELDESEVKIEVRDNGQGIAPELQNRVFDMYFRGNERSKGNGLGLYIVKKAVEKLNGRIEMESALHEGTTFHVFLPNQPMA